MYKIGQCPHRLNQRRASIRTFRIPGIGLVDSFHPDLDERRDWAWARGDYNCYSGTGHHSMILTRTEEGYSGVLTTHLNSCQGFATMEGCDKERCYRYHMPPGLIVSNVPGRRPVILGELDPSLKGLFRKLIKFDADTDAFIQTVNRSFMKKLRLKGEEAMAATEEKDKLDAERAEIESMIDVSRKRSYTQIDYHPPATMTLKPARRLPYVPPPSIIEIKAP